MPIQPGRIIRAPELAQRGAIVADGMRDTAVTGITTTETVIQFVTFDAVSGVRYELSGVQAVAGSATGLTIMRLRWQSGGSLTTSGTQFGSLGPPTPTANQSYSQPINGIFTSSVTGQISVGVALVRDGGSATLQSFGSINQTNTLIVRVA